MEWRSVVSLVFFATFSWGATQQPLEIPPGVQHGLQQVRSGRYQEALETSRSLKKSLPDHPLPDLVAAEAYWGLLFCETGHITAREVWHVADRKTSSYDKPFLEAVEKALAASERLRGAPERAARGALYSGLARGVRARLYTLREAKLQSASEGKQMRADLLEAVEQDEQLAPDASLGLGAYNYYADVLSPLLKVFRFFMGIPGGDRERGLEQLQIAAQQARLAGPEAQFELARIYGIRENRHPEALRLLEQLGEQSPGNALYVLAAAYQAEKTGRKLLALEYLQKALHAAETMDAVCRERLHNAAQGALNRLKEEPSR